MLEKLFKMISGFGAGTYSAMANALSQSIFFVAKIFYMPPFSWLANRINRKYVEPFKAKVTDSLVIDLIDTFFERYYKHNKLLSGDLEGYAREHYLEEEYPSFYKVIYAKIRRSIIVDSRLATGEPVAKLADGHMTKKRIASAIRHSITTASIWAGIALGAWFLASIASLVADLAVGGGALFSITQTVDYWNDQAEQSDMVFQSITGFTLYGLQWLAATLFSIKALALVAATFVFVLVNSTCFRLKNAMDVLAAPTQKFTKASKVGWKHNTDIRPVEYDAYLERMELYENYLIPNNLHHQVILGEATGLHLARNASASSSPQKGEEVGPDREAMFTGLMVCGNTGAGKTRYVIKPVMYQLLSDKSLGMYVTDAKAVLHYDAKQVAKSLGREGDIITVGTGDTDFGINLLSGMSPGQVADVLRDIMMVIAGKGGDGFWIQKAYLLIKAVAVLADTYNVIPDGEEYANDKGVLPYSLVFLYELIRDPELRNMVIEDIHKIIDNEYDDDGWRLDTFELRDAIKYFATEWATIGENTRTSIEATASQVLAEFNGAPDVIRERFATGNCQNIVDVDEALKGKIVCINLSMEEFPASRVLLMMLKSRLFALAMLRQREYKDRGLEAQREAPNCAMIGDEYQSLITVSDNGLSDGSFWNMARSTGLFFACCGFQNLSSLIKTVGKEKATDFVNMLVNKIVLNMNDLQTIEMIKQMSGKSPRYGVYDDNHYENWEAVKAEHGDGTIVDEEAELIDDPAYHSIGIVPYLAGFPAYQANVAIDRDDRFYDYARATSTINLTGGGAGKDDSLSYMQAAFNRQEDKSTSYLTHGNEFRDVVTNQEIMGQLTRGFAWASWMEGGQLRQDFLKLDRKKTEANEKDSKTEKDYEAMLQNSRDSIKPIQV